MKRSELALIGVGVAAIAAVVSSVGGDPRSRVVAAALGELGKGDPSPYWTDTLGSAIGAPAEWCGAFALWALHQAGLAKSWRWKVGTGFLFQLPQTTSPQPGDVAYFAKNQHHAVVRAVTPSAVSVINGNGNGRKVTTSDHPRSAVTAFYSIAPLLGA